MFFITQVKISKIIKQTASKINNLYTNCETNGTKQLCQIKGQRHGESKEQLDYIDQNKSTLVCPRKGCWEVELKIKENLCLII